MPKEETYSICQFAREIGELNFSQKYIQAEPMYTHTHTHTHTTTNSK